MKSLVLTLLLALTSCNYSLSKAPKEGPLSLDSESLSNPDFKTVQSAVLEKNCVDCHSNRGGNKGSLNLENFTNVRAKLSLIRYRSLEKKDMPPGEPLNGQDLAVLQN